jgi:metal-responsive CopG/Arc/MetJ family transcriptional regulator
MMKSITGTTKKRGRGRPPTTGIGTSLNVRLHDDVLDRLDAWISQQGEPDLSRPEAIRRLLNEALTAAAKRTKRKGGS